MEGELMNGLIKGGGGNYKALFTLPLELKFGSGITIVLDSKLSAVSSQSLEMKCHFIYQTTSP